MGLIERQSGAEESVQARAGVGVFCQFAFLLNWDGSMRWRTRLGLAATSARAHGSADGAAVCRAVGQDPQERCVGRRSDLRSGRPSEHALCTDQDDGTTRAAGLTPGPEGFVKARTAQANQIRGLLAEYGIVMP